MKTTLQFRLPMDEFDEYKSMVDLSNTSMSRLLEDGIEKIANQPDLLGDIINMFLAEAGLSHDK